MLHFSPSQFLNSPIMSFDMALPASSTPVKKDLDEKVHKRINDKPLSYHFFRIHFSL